MAKPSHSLYRLLLLLFLPGCCGFLCWAAADLKVNAIYSPGVIGAKWTIQFVVSNLGPDIATSVILTNHIPRFLPATAMTTSQGISRQEGDIAIFEMGTLAKGARAIASFQITTAIRDIYLFDAGVWAAQADSNPGNNLTSLALQPDVDGDADGMTDAYELDNSLNPFSKADKTTDADLDGISNYQEFLAGTQAKNSNSIFRISGLSLIGTNALISFSSATNRFYRLESCTGTNLLEWKPVSDFIPGTSGNLIVEDMGGATSPQKIYRLSLMP